MSCFSSAGVAIGSPYSLFCRMVHIIADGHHQLVQLQALQRLFFWEFYFQPKIKLRQTPERDQFLIKGHLKKASCAYFRSAHSLLDIKYYMEQVQNTSGNCISLFNITCIACCKTVDVKSSINLDVTARVPRRS